MFHSSQFHSLIIPDQNNMYVLVSIFLSIENRLANPIELLSSFYSALNTSTHKWSFKSIVNTHINCNLSKCIIYRCDSRTELLRTTMTAGCFIQTVAHKLIRPPQHARYITANSTFDHYPKEMRAQSAHSTDPIRVISTCISHTHKNDIPSRQASRFIGTLPN